MFTKCETCDFGVKIACFTFREVHMMMTAMFILGLQSSYATRLGCAWVKVHDCEKLTFTSCQLDQVWNMRFWGQNRMFHIWWSYNFDDFNVEFDDETELCNMFVVCLGQISHWWKFDLHHLPTSPNTKHAFLTPKTYVLCLVKYTCWWLKCSFLGYNWGMQHVLGVLGSKFTFVKNWLSPLANFTKCETCVFDPKNACFTFGEVGKLMTSMFNPTMKLGWATWLKCV